MKNNKLCKIFSFILFAFIVTFFVNPTRLYAASLSFQGTFEAPIKLDLKMGASAFSDKVTIEHQKDNYYLTFTQVDSSNLAEMKLLKDGLVGTIIREEGNTKAYTYTLTLEDLKKPLHFSVIVTVMNKLVDFTMTIDLDNAKYLSDTIEDRGERPALFIPTITTNASNQEVEKGSYYFIPEATSLVNNESIEVNVKAYYKDNLNLTEVNITDGKIKLDKVGEYVIKYSSSSDLYKTSLGNPTKAELIISIKSKIGASTLAKVEDFNTILPVGYQVQSSLIITGDEFDKVKNLLLKKADNFQIINVTMYNEDGSKIDLENEIKLYLRADDYFNRQEIEVYYLNNDKLEKIEEENFGRYIGLNTSKLGTFIILVPGVAFHMPIWGYVLIAIGAVLIIGSIIVIPIIIKTKRRKALNK